MPQSLSAIYVHAIFHVKSTSVEIHDKHFEGLQAYTYALLCNNGCDAIQIGCVRDHMHLLFRLAPTMPLANLIGKIKFATNQYLKSIDGVYRLGFEWQAGYAAYSVGYKQLPLAKAYVANQRDHHKDKSFTDEYLQFLRGNNVDFDEEYVFKD